MYPRTENTPEVHPLLRQSLTITDSTKFPEISINTTDPDSSFVAVMNFKSSDPQFTGESFLIAPMVLEAMKIVVANNPNIAEGTQIWMQMCLGLAQRHNDRGYINYEPISRTK